MFAIIETGGKQYKVRAGDVVTVERLEADAGSSFSFEKVLAVSDGEGLTYGTPYLSGASVKATVIGDGKGKKIVVFKYKAKKGYKRKIGHRQPFTKLKIDSIETA